MPRQINYDAAAKKLADAFASAESAFRDNLTINLPAQVADNVERLFSSETQAYREALAGCALVRNLDREVDIRYPETTGGPDSFSGRTLAERVVTPFMVARRIPVSKSPYLSSLRGGARFVTGGAPRIQRDAEGFQALVDAVDYLHHANEVAAQEFFGALLLRFIVLREGADIPLKQFGKPNLAQLDHLIGALLEVKSGGRFPAFFATAMFQTLSECHGLGWNVEFQGINVADAASGAVGDITISKGGTILLGVEVTERMVGKARVTQTFDDKVSPNKLDDYLFISTATPDEEAYQAAKKFTAVGHEMNFVPLRPWLHANLSTVGPSCRAIFQARLIELMNVPSVPADLKVAWNDRMDQAIGV